MKTKIMSLGLIAASFLFFNCSNNDDTTEIQPTDDLQATVLLDLTQNIISETYSDLNNKALGLKQAINTFVTTATEANLTAVKNAWIETRKPWEQSEGFLYGPVETEGIDPAMDTWPVDVEAMNNILNSNQSITVSLLSSNNEARGFHLIEFLVWGEDGTKKATDITERQKQYLKAAAEDLQINTQFLYNAWKIDGGNYGKNFTTAGLTNLLYPSKVAALEEIVAGLITIADEVASGKIEDPLNSEGTTPFPEKEESRFSNNSKLDFADNMRSIRNIYLGQYGKDFNGLTHIVSKENKALDSEIKAKIENAIKAIEAIPGTFTKAIHNNRQEVIAAQNKVKELQMVLQTKLKPFINSL